MWATTSPKLRAALHAFYGWWIERASLFRSGVVGTMDEDREHALRETLGTLLGRAKISG